MKTYCVKEIAEMLNTNPETVRRWIRDNKLDATIESKKSGHIIYESALRDFLKNSPKYAAVAKASLGGIAAAVTIPTIMIGGAVVQKIIDTDQLKKARISKKDVIDFLCGEIQLYVDSVKAKEDTIHQLQKQIETDQLQIAEFQKIIDELSIKRED